MLADGLAAGLALPGVDGGLREQVTFGIQGRPAETLEVAGADTGSDAPGHCALPFKFG